jgi:mannosylglycoprotein endo-beta-mannosidase
MRNVNDELAQLRRDEETKWAQQAKVKHIQEGGNNTKYFHLIANGKHRRKKILQLEQREGTIVGQNSLKTYIFEYYKSLFGDPTPNHFGMLESENNDIPQLSDEENRILTTDFTEKEVHRAILQMEKNKAPSPDGFLVEFYHKFWDVIKVDLMAMFYVFQRNELPLFHLNFDTIILLPTKENAVQI